MLQLEMKKRDASKQSNAALKAEGKVPAVCYGPHFESTPVIIDDVEFRKVYREAGTSGVIQITGDVDEQCLVQDMQAHVVTGELQHVDFKILTKGETTEVTVSIELVGTSPAKENRIGLLNFSHKEIVLETIPSKIPESIEVDISGLENLGDAIKISDLNLGDDVTILDEDTTTIVSITEFDEEEPEDEEMTDIAMEPELVDQKGKGEEEGSEGDSQEKDAE